jgi:hypothetical protein
MVSDGDGIDTTYIDYLCKYMHTYIQLFTYIDT